MTATEQHVDELRLDYPGLEFRLWRRGQDRPVIEAWREGAPGSGFYAMIGDDPAEIRQALDAAGYRPAGRRQPAGAPARAALAWQQGGAPRAVIPGQRRRSGAS